MNEIEWTEFARDQLADLWVAATPAERVGFETHILRLERKLKDDPIAVGESRSGTIRVIVLAPLVVWFDVGFSRVRIFRVTRPRHR